MNKASDSNYTLLWSDAPDFVRLAASCRAVIVPFAAVGADDAYDVALEPRQLLEMPVIGDLIKVLFFPFCVFLLCVLRSYAAAKSISHTHTHTHKPKTSHPTPPKTTKNLNQNQNDKGGAQPDRPCARPRRDGAALDAPAAARAALAAARAQPAGVCVLLVLLVFLCCALL